MTLRKIALLFPGQGSQKIGMGRAIAEAFVEAKDCFQEVNEALSQNLSELMFSGDQNLLTQTANAQPAIMATSMAVWSVLKKHVSSAADTKHSIVSAGHSVGEYAALCSAGAFDIASAAHLLRIRGKAMQASVPLGHGGMVALLGASVDVAEKLSEAASKFGICEIANDNGAEQIVLSGTIQAMNKVLELAEQFGIKRAVKLAVTAPFHSSLMKPAAKIMKNALSEVDFKAMSFPVIANHDAKMNSDEKRIADLLTAQIEGRVRWRESMNLIGDDAIYIEIGCGNVLSNLIKRMKPEAEVFSVHEPADIDVVVERLQAL